MITTNCPAEATHSALSITPAAGSNRDRAATSAASDNTSTECRHPPASTEPGSGTVNDQPPAHAVVHTQPQHGVPIQQGLQHDHHVGLGSPPPGPAPPASG